MADQKSYVIPPYPRHLSDDERNAVREKAARDYDEHHRQTMLEKGFSKEVYDRQAGRSALAAVALLLVTAKWQGERIRELETRLGTVESKAARYSGVWQRALEYRRNDLTTHDGCLFSCIKDGTNAEPGKSADWQLMAKGGQR